MSRFRPPDPTRDRRCEVCHIPLTIIGSLCRVHLERRGDFGHTKLRGLPILRRNPRGGRASREWAANIPLVKSWFKADPITQEIEYALQRVLELLLWKSSA